MVKVLKFAVVAGAAILLGYLLFPGSASSFGRLNNAGDRKMLSLDLPVLEGGQWSLSEQHGKIVLVNFWATWCPPCRAELPNVIKTYEANHKAGFEIIGISLDQDKQKLTSFMKDKNMTWAQYFDGRGWQNKLAAKYGVESIPATFLLDRQGTVIGKDLRGAELDQAVVKALAKK